MHHFCRQSSTQAREEYTPTQDATAAAPRARRVAKKGLAAHPVPGDNKESPLPQSKTGNLSLEPKLYNTCSKLLHTGPPSGDYAKMTDAAKGRQSHPVPAVRVKRHQVWLLPDCYKIREGRKKKKKKKKQANWQKIDKSREREPAAAIIGSPVRSALHGIAWMGCE